MFWRKAFDAFHGIFKIAGKNLIKTIIFTLCCIIKSLYIIEFTGPGSVYLNLEEIHTTYFNIYCLVQEGN